MPRVVGAIRRRHPVEVRDVEFLRANTDRKIKMTVPGPFTMAQQCEDHYYRDEAALALDYAAAVNAEIKDLFAAGADIVQLDEPWMQARPDKAKAYGLAALDRALKGVTGTTAIHLCFGYAQMVKSKPSGYSFLPELEQTAAQQISIEAAQPKLDLAVLKELPSKTIILGVIDLSDMTVETPEMVAERIRRALPHVPAERIVIAPDCGMKYLPRDVAFGKMQAMVDGRRDRAPRTHRTTSPRHDANKAAVPRRPCRQPAALRAAQGGARQAREGRDHAGAAQGDRGSRDRGDHQEAGGGRAQVDHRRRIPPRVLELRLPRQARRRRGLSRRAQDRVPGRAAEADDAARHRQARRLQRRIR